MGDKELPSLLRAQTVPLSADAACCNAVGSTATAAAVAAVATSTSTSTSTLRTTTESESGHRDGDTVFTSTLLGKRKAVDSPTTPQSTNNPDGSSKDDKPTNNNNNYNSTSTSTPGVKRKKQDWTAVQDETLMLAVSAFRKTKKDLDGVDWKFGEEDDDDWDEIARDVPGKSPVQCLQRYMRHLNKKDESSSRVVSLSAVDVESSSTVPSGSNNNNPVTLTESKVSCGRVLER